MILDFMKRSKFHHRRFARNAEGKGACLNCHRVNGKGSRKAPDLSDVGSVRSAGSIERSLVEPDIQMMPIKSGSSDSTSKRSIASAEPDAAAKERATSQPAQPPGSVWRC